MIVSSRLRRRQRQTRPIIPLLLLVVVVSLCVACRLLFVSDLTTVIDDKEDVTSSTTRIALITFSHLANLDSFQHLILPSLETWLPRRCTLLCRVEQSLGNTQYNEFCQGMSSPFPSDFCQRISPIFVDCPVTQWGYSPCCKQEQGLIQIHNQYGNALTIGFSMRR